MRDRSSTRRRVILGVGALTGLAGCAGLLGDEGAPTSQSPTPPREPTEATTATQSQTQTETEQEGPGYKDDHWHGRLFFEINGDLVDFAQPKYNLKNLEDERPETVYFHFHVSGHGPNEWSNEKEIVTFQRALNLLPEIEYGRRGDDHVVTYDGTTFDASRSETTISIHRGTEQIDPTTYEVQHNDNFWVNIRTDGESQSDPEQRSGKLIVDVNNRRLAFGAETSRQTDSEGLEFRDDGKPYTWYNTGEPVTLDQALDTLPNVAYERDSDGKHVITYEADGELGGRYHEAEDATQIIVRQRTTPVDPTTYELQNEDIIWVYVRHTPNAPDNEQ